MFVTLIIVESISLLGNISKRAWRIHYGKVDNSLVIWKENGFWQGEFPHEALAESCATVLKMEERKAFKLCMVVIF